MRNLLFITAITLFISCFVVSCNNVEKKTENTGQTDQAPKAKYACPMHPEETSDKPGTCSKCGMDLEETNKTDTSSVE